MNYYYYRCQFWNRETTSLNNMECLSCLDCGKWCWTRFQWICKICAFFSPCFFCLILLLDNRLLPAFRTIVIVPLLPTWWSLCYSCSSYCGYSIQCCVNIGRITEFSLVQIRELILSIPLLLWLLLLSTITASILMPHLLHPHLLPLSKLLSLLRLLIANIITNIIIFISLSKFALTKNFRSSYCCISCCYFPLFYQTTTTTTNNNNNSIIQSSSGQQAELEEKHEVTSTSDSNTLHPHHHNHPRQQPEINKSKLPVTISTTFHSTIAHSVSLLLSYSTSTFKLTSGRFSKSSIASTVYTRFLLLIAIFASLNAANGLKILHYSIPRMVDAANASAATLDCVYTYDPGDVKLVVRWFHNDSPEPIYQWIPEADIRYVGELIRPYFDMDFKVSTDRYSKFRALRLVRANHRPLPVELSGNFSCVISSIANQDSRQGQMVVYVPPMKFEFHFVELSVDQIGLECRARDVYPKPVLTFSEQFSSNHSYYHRFPSINVSIAYQPESSFYSASFLHPISSILRAGTIYECRLELPGTNYIRKKRIKIIFPTNYSFKPGRIDKSFSLSVSSSSAPTLNANLNILFLVNLLLMLMLRQSFPIVKKTIK